MNKAVSLSLLIIGIILIIYGVSAADSIGSRFSRFISGSPTDETIWLLLGGVVATIVGAGGMFTGTRKA